MLIDSKRSFFRIDNVTIGIGAKSRLLDGSSNTSVKKDIRREDGFEQIVNYFNNGLVYYD